MALKYVRKYEYRIIGYAAYGLGGVSSDKSVSVMSSLDFNFLRLAMRIY